MSVATMPSSSVSSVVTITEKAADEMNRARAMQVVSSALEAMATAKEIRRVAATPAGLDAPRSES